MNTGKLMERVSLRPAPAPEETVAELELLQFETDLLRARLADEERLDQELNHLQRALDAAAAENVDLRFQLAAEQRRTESLETSLDSARQSLDREQEAVAALVRERSELTGAVAAADTTVGGLTSRIEALEVSLRAEREQRQQLADRLTGADAGRKTAISQIEAATREAKQLREEAERLVCERDSLELELLGVLRKLGRFPQGAIFRRLPAYQRLLDRHRDKLSAP